MAKNITRTINTYTIRYLALDDSDSVVELYTTTDESNPAMPRYPEKVAAAAAKDLGFTFIKVKSTSTDSYLYAMPVSDFLAHATRVI